MDIFIKICCIVIIMQILVVQFQNYNKNKNKFIKLIFDIMVDILFYTMSMSLADHELDYIKYMEHRVETILLQGTFYHV